MAKKRNLLSDNVTATSSKKKQKQSATTDSDTDLTRRGSRSKNFKAPNATASARGTQSAIAQGKKTSKLKIITDQLIPLKEPRDAQHKRVVFINNETGEPAFALYRKTEKAEPMAHLWSEFLRTSQTARDNIGLEAMGSPLSQEECDAINLKNNAHIFPALITTKGGLRSKDNLEASTSNAQRNEGGTFSRGGVTATDAEILRSRASSLRKKAAALEKQAEAYQKLSEKLLLQGGSMPREIPLSSRGMAFIGDDLAMKKEDVNRYIVDHEDHLAATAEKLRTEMTSLAVYVNRAEKRLRDQVQLKIAADLKLCRDIKRFGKFEVKAWQMGALPIDAHICWCDLCSGGHDRNADPVYENSNVPLQYQSSNGLPQARRKDALPEIKLEEEEESEDDGDRGMLHLLRNPPVRPTANATNTGSAPTPATATTPNAIDNANEHNQTTLAALNPSLNAPAGDDVNQATATPNNNGQLRDFPDLFGTEPFIMNSPNDADSQNNIDNDGAGSNETSSDRSVSHGPVGDGPVDDGFIGDDT